MAFTSMAFDPVDGLLNQTEYPTQPADETAMRTAVQDPSNQLRDFINNTLISELTSTESSASGSEYIGSATVTGVTGNTVWAQIASLKDLVTSIQTDELGLSPGVILTEHIANDAVTADKLADDSVSSANILSDAVTTSKILDANVTEAKIATGAVTATKIADTSVSSAKIAAGAVTAAKIGTGAVTEAKILDGAVTDAKIGNRTLDDDISEALLVTTTGDLQYLLNAIVTRIKDIAGALHWFTLPASSIADIVTALATKQAAITGAASTIDTEDLTASRALASNASGKVAVSAVTATELGHLAGVTSALQTQLDAKQATITGAATSVVSSNLANNVAVITGANGKIASSSITSTELGHLSGVTSAIQTQLNAKQAVVSGVSSTEIGYLDGVTSAIQTQIDSKQAVVSGVSSTEIGYLDGVTSAIQTQINAKVGDTGDTMTGEYTITGTSGSPTPLVLRGYGTSAIQIWQNSAGVVVAYMDQNGDIQKVS